MSKWLADNVGLVEGEKAIFVTEMSGVRYLRALTVREVIGDANGNIIVYCEEVEGYAMPRDLYSKEKIMRILGE